MQNKTSIHFIFDALYKEKPPNYDFISDGKQAVNRLARIGEGIEGLGRIMGADLETRVPARDFASIGMLIEELGCVTSLLGCAASEALERVPCINKSHLVEAANQEHDNNAETGAPLPDSQESIINAMIRHLTRVTRGEV